MDYIMLLSELHWFVHTETLPNVIVCCMAFGIRQIHSRSTKEVQVTELVIKMVHLQHRSMACSPRKRLQMALVCFTDNMKKFSLRQGLSPREQRALLVDGINQRCFYFWLCVLLRHVTIQLESNECLEASVLLNLHSRCLT